VVAGRTAKPAGRCGWRPVQPLNAEPFFLQTIWVGNYAQLIMTGLPSSGIGAQVICWPP
jgi:hypothetical protein